MCSEHVQAFPLSPTLNYLYRIEAVLKHPNSPRGGLKWAGGRRKSFYGNVGPLSERSLRVWYLEEASH